MSGAIIKEIDSYLRLLFPITRSITGDGNRETLRLLRPVCPIRLHEVPTGSSVFDWIVPKEWKIIAAKGISTT